MQAIVVSTPGDASVLTWETVDDPVAEPGQVLIDVAASAVNRADILQRQGVYEPPTGAQPYLGLECSGRIAALGDGVSGWSVGDEVCALLSGGGYATRVAVAAGLLLPVPDRVSLIEAAALPEAVCTVWSMVFMSAALQPSETLLVHGGASGVGTMAIQLGRQLGAQVLVTAGSAAKIERCVELGAAAGVNYRSEDFVERVMDITDGGGADVILDNMGASYLARNIDVLAFEGRLVVIGLQGGRRAELDLSKLMAKRVAILGALLRTRPLDEKATIVSSVRQHVWPLFASGDISPDVDRVVSMKDAAEAHRVVEASEHVGKVLLEVT
jgi:putative PIG3 family NAD(P)H quinone oxidoreductase